MIILWIVSWALHIVSFTILILLIWQIILQRRSTNHFRQQLHHSHLVRVDDLECARYCSYTTSTQTPPRPAPNTTAPRSASTRTTASRFPSPKRPRAPQVHRFPFQSDTEDEDDPDLIEFSNSTHSPDTMRPPIPSKSPLRYIRNVNAERQGQRVWVSRARIASWNSEMHGIIEQVGAGRGQSIRRSSPASSGPYGNLRHAYGGKEDVDE